MVSNIPGPNLAEKRQPDQAAEHEVPSSSRSGTAIHRASEGAATSSAGSQGRSDATISAASAISAGMNIT